ncbi:MAG: NGG1p interacting factor NIF3 [Candidatus Omnitrophota bacterium]|nr:NGG1p interacting factor NIF3 [Candidatus Omnitrophota bacterium]
MQLLQIYQHIVKFGIASDPRKGKSKIKGYADTAVLYGAAHTEVKKILVGIDIEIGEILLAERIKASDGLDLVIAHHPEGGALAIFYEVMRLQIDLLKDAGIKEEVARQFLEERLDEVRRRLLPANHMRTVDAARLLDIPLMCVHTPADNHVSAYIDNLFKLKHPKKVKDILYLLKAISEYQISAKESHVEPRLLLGNENRNTGKIFIEMTGGTEGHKEVYEKLYKKGIRTLVCMHMSEEHFKKVRDIGMNVIIAGHISSDNLGLNLILDKLEAASGSEFLTLTCSGFRRIRRN